MSDRKPTPDLMGGIDIMDDILSAGTKTPDRHTERLPVASIRKNGGTQVRAQTDWLVVDEYVNAMKEGVIFPPVVVFFDGETHWLADGFHRVEAAERAGVTELAADVRRGVQRDAVLFACGANAAHGLRRTNADKRRAVETLLSDVEWAKWSDGEIARRCAVSQHFVSSMRPKISQIESEIPTVRTVTRNGKTYTQDTTNIGKRSATKTLESSVPIAPLPNWARDDAPAAPVKVEYWTPTPPTPASPEPPAWTQDSEPKHQVQTADDFTCPQCGSHEFDDGGSGQVDSLICSRCGWFEEIASGVEDDLTVSISGGTTSVYVDDVECDPPDIGNRLPSYTINIINADAQNVGSLVSHPVHLVVTSPPYNVGIEYDQHNDDLSTYLPMLMNVWRGCYQVMADGARIAVVVPFGVGRNPYVPFDGPIMHTLISAGFTLRGRIVWDKNTTGNRTSWGSYRLPSSPSIRDTTECIIVAHKGSDTLDVPVDLKHRDDKGVCTEWLADGDYFMGLAQDHWIVAPESAQRIKHPAPFPVDLVTRLIHFYAFPGAHILDPFGGSGTVGVAAKQLGCKATLIEISADYCQLAEERISR